MKHRGSKYDQAARTQGGEAYLRGLDEKDNPYERETVSGMEWQRGWWNRASTCPESPTRKKALRLRAKMMREEK